MSILASRRIVPLSYTVTLQVKTLHLTSLSARSLGEGSEEQESPCHCALFRTSLDQRSDLLSERSSGGEEGRGRSRGKKCILICPTFGHKKRTQTFGFVWTPFQLKVHIKCCKNLDCHNLWTHRLNKDMLSLLTQWVFNCTKYVPCMFNCLNQYFIWPSFCSSV